MSTKHYIWLIASLLVAVGLGYAAWMLSRPAVPTRQLSDVIADYKASLPIKCEDMNGYIIDVKLSADSNVVEYIKVSDSLFENIKKYRSMLTTVNNIERMLEKPSDHLFDGYPVGKREVYVNNHRSDSIVVEVPYSRLKAVRDGVKTGKIAPYSYLQELHQQLAIDSFPVEIEEGTVLERISVNDNRIVYDIRFDTKVTSGDIKKEKWEAEREAISSVLRHDYQPFSKYFKKEDIYVDLIYSNVDDEEIFTLTFTPRELFP